MVESDDEEKPFHNPLNLPLGWDGKPIPFWLYKLHGLGIEYPAQLRPALCMCMCMCLVALYRACLVPCCTLQRSSAAVAIAYSEYRQLRSMWR